MKRSREEANLGSAPVVLKRWNQGSQVLKKEPTKPNSFKLNSSNKIVENRSILSSQTIKKPAPKLFNNSVVKNSKLNGHNAKPLPTLTKPKNYLSRNLTKKSNTPFTQPKKELDFKCESKPSKLSPVTFPARRALIPSPLKSPLSSQHNKSSLSEKSLNLSYTLPTSNLKKDISSLNRPETKLKEKPLPYLGNLSLEPALELASQFGFKLSESATTENVDFDSTLSIQNTQDDVFNLKQKLQRLRLQYDLLLHRDKVGQVIYNIQTNSINSSVTHLNHLIDTALVNSHRILGTLRQPLIHQKSLRLETSFQKKFSDLFITINTIFMNSQLMKNPQLFDSFQESKMGTITSLFKAISQLSATLQNLGDILLRIDSSTCTIFSGEPAL